MKRHIFTLILTCMSCLTICNAQKLLPIMGRVVDYELTGAVDIEFSNNKNQMLLSNIIDWSEGDSYTIYFREPVPISGIRIGEDEIPVGATSFQGHNPPHEPFQWTNAKGELIEVNNAWIMLTSNFPTKLHIKEVFINRKDGSKFRTNYPYYYSTNTQHERKMIEWESKSGKKLEHYIDVEARLYKVDYYSSKVFFRRSNSNIGGTEWSNLKGNMTQYRLKLYRPTTTDVFAWKYVTKTGKTCYQKIGKNTSVSTLNIDDEVTECYIVPLGYGKDTYDEFLDIQEICLQDGSQPKIETLVLWHANGTTTEISLHKKPRVTFSPNKVMIKGSGVNFEYPSKDIIKFTYKKEDVVNEIDAPMNQANFTRDEERIVFNGIKSSDEVVLYKLNGSHVPVHLTHTINGDITFSLSDIPFGVYILNVNGSTYKIVKR